MTQTVRDLGEFGLIGQLQRLLARGAARGGKKRAAVVAGIGDDCAVLPGGGAGDYLLYTCDPVVEGVHFLAKTPPRQVGWKAMARNLSDIAAMGGRPCWAVVSIGLRPETPARYVREIYRGLDRAAGRFGCRIVGGDTTHVRDEQFVVVALLGVVEKSRLARRSGARVGDAVFVTGVLGGSLRGKHLRFVPRIDEARWLVGHFPVRAMIDISDGLSSDLQRLIDASAGRIGFAIRAARIPRARAARGSLAAAWNDGEDFELLFTIDARHSAALQRQWSRQFALPLTEIGRVIRAPGRIQLVNSEGKTVVVQPGGYDHFARPQSSSSSVVRRSATGNVPKRPRTTTRARTIGGR